MSAAPSHSRAADTTAPALGGGPPGRGRTRLLAAAAFLAASWSAILLLLDVTTARPRIVSRDQILSSNLVVIARHPAGTEFVKIERVYRGRKEPGSEIRVVNLTDVRGLVDDQPYVFPLSVFRGDYIVTRFERQQVPPLVYPAIPEVIEQVKAILRDAPVELDDADSQ